MATTETTPQTTTNIAASPERRVLGVPGIAWSGVFVVAMTALPFIMSEFQTIILTDMLIVGIFALSLNLILGYGGMVHFGHAAFYGAGAYTVGILTVRFGWNPWLAMMLAPITAAALGAVIGWFCVRRVELYFAILTLAFGQLVWTVANKARGLTGGDDGLPGVPTPALLDNTLNMYFFTLTVFLVVFLVIRMIVNSPFVLILLATRENPQRARFIGINVRRHQLITFIIGSAFAGLAGALMAVEKSFVSLGMLHWTTSAEPILASLLGGMYVLVGPAIGAAILEFLHFNLGRVTPYWPLVLGIMTVCIVLFAPSGFAGLFQQWFMRDVEKKEN
jgi:branched-chain amino acid transport system permease protein